MPNNNNNDNNTHLRNKIDFMLFISVTNANCNGDPLNGNRPRTNYDGYGEISDVCIKRKIRNRMQDLGKEIFVQSEDRATDGATSLKKRFETFKNKTEEEFNIKLKEEFNKKLEEELNKTTDEKLKKELKKKLDNELKERLKQGISKDELAKEGCKKWLDVRTFGQVFAFGNDDNTGVSIGIRGPVSIHIANSIDSVEISSMQITKSVNGEDNTNSKKSSDTMGMKHFVRYGLYQIKGSINVQLAEKTGFTKEDAETFKQCLKTLFINDESSARPAGSMEVEKIYWWEHNCKTGQYSTADVHRSVTAERKNKEKIPTSFDDYEIKENSLTDLEPEIIKSSDCNK